MNDFATHLTANTAKTTVFKDHPQIPVLIDALIRRERHHLLLTDSAAKKFNIALMKSLVVQLAQATTPKSYREGEIIYLDFAKLILQDINQDLLEENLSILCRKIHDEKKPVLFAIDLTTHFFANLNRLLKFILQNPQHRIILFAQKNEIAHLQHLFSTFTVNEPTQDELLSLLKNLRDELEGYHHVIIPDETVSSALFMATHYLPAQTRLEETIELLDSSAARANKEDSQDKPIVTTMLLEQTISNRTHIPVSHLHHNLFQNAQFTSAMQRRIYGQDSAITAMGSLLQQACINLYKKNGPLCSFLFVGPCDTGKTDVAYAMAEHLFGHTKALLHVNLSKAHYASFHDIKIMSQAHENRSLSLLEAIKQTPYAVVLIDNINQAPAGTLDFFRDIFIQGYAVDAEGRHFDFRNAIVIMTTTVSSEKICHFMQTPATQENAKALDLMQLVLNENIHDISSHAHQSLSLDELNEEIMPSLEAYFSANLLQNINIIPFVPLDYPALEKIMRLKIKLLAKQLETQFGIELNYAPEVVKFIAHEALWRKPQAKSLDKLLERYLYSCVTHEILAHSEDKNRPTRLMLKLNDNGQVLRCEFITTNDAGLYSV